MKCSSMAFLPRSPLWKSQITFFSGCFYPATVPANYWSAESNGHLKMTELLYRKAIIYCDCAASHPNYVWWTLMWQLVLVLLHSTQLKIKMLRETRRTWWVAAIVPVIRTVNVNCILPFMYVDMSKWQEAEQGSGNEARHELCSSVVLVNYNFN